MDEENSLIKRNIWFITLAVIGGIFLLSSFIGELYLKQYSLMNQLCSIIGLIILTVPFIIIAIKNLSKGKVYMNELVLLAILATSITGRFKTAGIIVLFLLLTITFEKQEDKHHKISSAD